MSVIQELYELTKVLLAFVEQDLPQIDDERDTFIAELDKQLTFRDLLIQQLDGKTMSEQEKEIGQKLLQLERQMKRRLEAIQETIRSNLIELETKKKTNQRYENPYDGLSDGIFFDKRGI